MKIKFKKESLIIAHLKFIVMQRFINEIMQILTRSIMETSLFAQTYLDEGPRLEA